jgi:hypothetical protein
MDGTMAVRSSQRISRHSPRITRIAPHRALPSAALSLAQPLLNVRLPDNAVAQQRPRASLPGPHASINPVCGLAQFKPVQDNR